MHSLTKSTAFGPLPGVLLSLLLTVGGIFPVQGGERDGMIPKDSVEVRLRRAMTLHEGYDFSGAIGLCEDLLSEGDLDDAQRKRVSLQRERSLLAENFQSSCLSLSCIARKRFSRDEYLLYYPLPDRSWHDLLVEGGKTQKVYVPRAARSLLFSSRDRTGVMNMYRSQVVDTLAAQQPDSLPVRSLRPGDFLWSSPALVGEAVTGYSNEIFPMLSPDGKTLYFASDGFGGMGGYDLFESEWDEGTSSWGEPRNLGFPFNTPADDLMLMASQDGKYLIFASDRDCPRDSVNVYVLENDTKAARLPVFDAQGLRTLCSLDPKADPSVIDNSALFSGRSRNWPLIEQFSSLYGRVRELGKKTSLQRVELDSLRAAVSEEDRLRREERIDSLENALEFDRDTLRSIRSRLNAVEKLFIAEGPSLNSEALTREADRDILTDESGYAFSRMSEGDPLNLTFMPKSRGEFLLFSQSSPSKVEDAPAVLYRIKYLSLRPGENSALDNMPPGPIYREVEPSGREHYYCGMFGVYEDALDELNYVRSLGYPEAKVTAWLGDEEVSVQRSKEALLSVHELFHLRIYPQDGKSLSGVERTVLDSIIPTGVSRSIQDGAVSYVSADYDTKEEALSYKTRLEERGMIHVEVESSGMSLPK